MSVNTKEDILEATSMSVMDIVELVKQMEEKEFLRRLLL